MSTCRRSVQVRRVSIDRPLEAAPTHLAALVVYGILEHFGDMRKDAVFRFECSCKAVCTRTIMLVRCACMCIILQLYPVDKRCKKKHLAAAAFKRRAHAHPSFAISPHLVLARSKTELAPSFTALPGPLAAWFMAGGLVR